MAYIGIKEAERVLNPYYKEVGNILREFLKKAGWATEGPLRWYLVPTDLGKPHVKLSKVKGYASKINREDLEQLIMERNDLVMEIVNDRRRKKDEFEQRFELYYFRKQVRYAQYMLSDVEFPERDVWKHDLKNHITLGEDCYRRSLGLTPLWNNAIDL